MTRFSTMEWPPPFTPWPKTKMSLEQIKDGEEMVKKYPTKKGPSPDKTIAECTINLPLN